MLAIEDVVAHEREGYAAEVAAASEACYHLVGVLVGHGHLLLCLQTYDGLVQGHVVEHRTEGVLAVRCGGGELHGLRYGGAE